MNIETFSQHIRIIPTKKYPRLTNDNSLNINTAIVNGLNKCIAKVSLSKIQNENNIVIIKVSEQEGLCENQIHLYNFESLEHFEDFVKNMTKNGREIWNNTPTIYDSRHHLNYV